jgi:hypothetical protein
VAQELAAQGLAAGESAAEELRCLELVARSGAGAAAAACLPAPVADEAPEPADEVPEPADEAPEPVDEAPERSWAVAVLPPAGAGT